MSNIDLSTFLVARPSFLDGLGSVLDLGANPLEYNLSQTPEDADRLALAMDMQAIADDMRQVMAQFAEEHAERPAHGPAR